MQIIAALMIFLNIVFVILSGTFSISSKISSKVKTDEISNSNSSWQKFNQALLPFLGEAIKSVVTFGSNCQAKGRVVSFYNNKTIIKRFQTHNHLFDWMVPLNYTLLGIAAENNFTDAFGEEFLTVRPLLGVLSLFNDQYQFIFNHPFDGIGNFVSHKFLNDDLFHKYYYLIDEKFKLLTQKSQEAIHTDKKTLYIIYGDTTHSDPMAQRQEDFIAFTNSIKKHRNNNFLVLVLVTDSLSARNDYIFDTIIEGNLIIHQIQLYPYNLWSHKESITQWNNILNIFA